MPPNTTRELQTQKLDDRLNRSSTAIANPTEPISRGGWPELHVAAAAGDDAAVRSLLARGADPDERAVPPGGCAGATALHCAVVMGAAGVTRQLLEAGAAVDPRDEAGYTPLLIAAERGDLPVVKLLLRAGAQSWYELGDSCPIRLARRGRHHQVVALLKQVRGLR